MFCACYNQCLCSLGSGKQACSVFERECVSPDGSESIVRCKPITGRTHQIRVHLEWLGWCVVKDRHSQTLLCHAC